MKEQPVWNIQRIRAIDADAIYRQVDGLATGAVELSPTLYLDINDRDFEALGLQGWPGYAANALLDALDHYSPASMGNLERLIGLSEKLNFLIQVGEEVCEISGESAAEDEDEQAMLIRDLIDEFRQSNPGAVLDPAKPASSEGLSLFVDFYQQRFNQLIAEKNLPAAIVRHRNDFLAVLETPRMRRLIAKDQRQRIRQEAAAVPLIVVDPITARLENTNGDYLGWFRPDKRQCYIDPFSIRKLAQQQAHERCGDSGIENLFEAKLKHIVFHELFHAVTNDAYRRYGPGGHVEDASPADEDYFDSEDSGSVKVTSLWPKFFREAMVEKLAYIAYVTSAQVKPASFRTSGIPESVWRSATSANPKELIAPADVRGVKDRVGALYQTYRLLIDTMIAQLDWGRAGLTLTQAERLVVRAFTEMPVEAAGTAQERWPARKAFGAAVSQAAHPGFFNRFGNLVELVGPGQVLDILEDPAFDPHNPEFIPWMGNPAKRRTILRIGNIRKIEEVQKQLARLRQLSAPPNIIEGAEERVEEYLQAKKQAEAFEPALAGLKAYLAVKHGVRSRRLGAEERLTAAIFGHFERTQTIFPGTTDVDSIAALEYYRSTYIKKHGESS